MDASEQGVPRGHGLVWVAGDLCLCTCLAFCGVCLTDHRPMVACAAGAHVRPHFICTGGMVRGLSVCMWIVLGYPSTCHCCWSLMTAYYHFWLHAILRDAPPPHASVYTLLAADLKFLGPH